METIWTGGSTRLPSAPGITRATSARRRRSSRFHTTRGTEMSCGETPLASAALSSGGLEHCLGSCTSDGGEEWPCGARGRHSPQQQGARSDPGPVHGAPGAGVFADHCAVEGHPEKGALGLRVGEDQGVELHIRVFRRVTAHGTYGYGCVSANLEFAGQELLHASGALDDHDEVNGFRTELRAPTAASHLDEGRRAPAPCGAAGGNTLSLFGSEDETAFDHVGYDRHATCLPHDPVRNALVRRVHDLVHDSGGVIEAVDGILALRLRPAK